MTDERLAEIRARVEAACPAPWRVNTKDRAGEDWPIGFVLHGILDVGQDTDGTNWIVTTDGIRASQMVSGGAEEDATFIAHARTDIPDLLAEIGRLRIEIARLKKEAINLMAEDLINRHGS